jgi:hypothetical protein
VFLVFALSVVWYFAAPAGGISSSGPLPLLGADAYVLVLLALLVLLPARRIESGGASCELNRLDRRSVVISSDDHGGAMGTVPPRTTIGIGLRGRRPARSGAPGRGWE